MSLTQRTKIYTVKEFDFNKGKYVNETRTKSVYRLWTKVLPVLIALAIAGSGIAYGVAWGLHTWTRYGCFSVNYVDLRGGYAPDPALYTTIGVVDSYRDQQITMGEIGKWHAGDSYCGPITYGNGQSDPVVLFGPAVNTTHELPNSPYAPTNVGDAP